MTSVPERPADEGLAVEVEYAYDARRVRDAIKFLLTYTPPSYAEDEAAAEGER